MFRKKLLCLLVMIGGFLYGKSQAKLQLNPKPPAEHLHFPVTMPQISAAAFQPRFVQENPTGYSYLCRLELSIEAKSPVGVWLKLNDAPMVPGRLPSNADLRFKLLKF